MIRSFSTLLQLFLLSVVIEAGASDEGESERQRKLIIGGSRIAKNEFPFYVQSKGVTCGGSLVAKDVVVTAAHCAGEFHGDVLVGAWMRNSTAGSMAQWRKTLSRMVIYPQYDFNSDRNDYMMFKIEPVTKPGLVPIELNTNPNIPMLGDQFHCIGMGFNGTNFTYGNQLLKVPVRYIQPEYCQEQWSLLDDYYYYNETKTVYDESMFCAIGDVVDTKGPALGDSGGPVFDVATKRLVGIVSWGGPYPDKAATPFYPSVFSRVSFAAAWMKQTICKLTSDPRSLSYPCPAFRCPVDEQILGFPQAVIPNRTSFVKSNVAVKRIVQTPPPGSFVKSNTTTRVTISARNAITNAALTCSFNVTVGPVEFLGGATFVVNSTNVNRQRLTTPGETDYPRAKGYLHRVVLELKDRKLKGRGAKMSTQILIGKTWYKPITLIEGQSNTSVTLSPKLLFNDTLDMKVGLNSTKALLPGNVVAGDPLEYIVNVYFFGQKMY